ncbi:MAG: manganese catalase family protein [Oscillospiraceae bacterium]|nr:manganese catalase family protein [Oscillospiraceae bacterium]
MIISQYGGPDGELGASLRYLSQRFSMPYPELRGLLTDIGTEELGHLEMIGAIVHQLTRKLSEEQIRDAGYAPYFVDHTAGVYPTAASGFPWTAASMQVKGDPIADLTEDLAAEQKARVTYDNILCLSDDPDVNDVIKFLREREIVHFQRFGEALQNLRERLNQKNAYAMNPAFDK